MRAKYRLTYLDPKIVTTKEKNMYGEDVEVRYRMIRAVDGTFFGSEPIVFTGACPADDDYRVNDIVSGELRDPRQPTYLHDVMLESRTIIDEPEPIELPEPPAPAVAEPQQDVLAFTIHSGYALSHSEVGALGRRFLKLEAQFHEHLKLCGTK